MEKVTVMSDDDHARMVAREGSWLCDIFQSHGFNCAQKLLVMKKLIKKIKQKKREEAHG